MDRELSQLLLRRGEILGRIRQQRVEVSELAGQLKPALNWADRGLSALDHVRQHPYVAGMVALLVLWRRRGLLGVLGSGFKMWRSWRMFALLRNKILSHLTAH
ncbi:MAG: YqjK family protein [Gallionella sp.]|nr:YqjK family protein [Gallionella sp.]